MTPEEQAAPQARPRRRRHTAPAAQAEAAGEAAGRAAQAEESKQAAETFTVTPEPRWRSWRSLAARQLAAREGPARAADGGVRQLPQAHQPRRRTSLYQDAKADTIQEFLAVYDNLERAVVPSRGTRSPPTRRGMEHDLPRSTRAILEEAGRCGDGGPAGQPFDPERHNAVHAHRGREPGGERGVPGVPEAGFTAGGQGDPARHRCRWPTEISLKVHEPSRRDRQRAAAHSLRSHLFCALRGAFPRHMSLGKA